MQSTYAAPNTLSEVVALLAANPGSRILAGGQRLLVEPNRRKTAGSLLVDLRRVSELTGIQVNDGALRIGATTTIADIAASELVRKNCPILAEVAAMVGDAQARNRATIGGAVADSEASSDLIPVLMVLGATIETTGQPGRSAADEFFGRSNRNAAEVVTAITIPAQERGSGAMYEKIKDPATLSAVCGVAASATVSGKVTQCRVAVTGSTERPVRLPDVESRLTGSEPTADSVANAVSAIDGRLTYRNDYYATSQYREHLTRVLATRALRGAAARATQGG